MRRLVLAGVLMLAACAPKVTDKPDYTVSINAKWDETADCIYSDFITNQGKSPGNINLAKVAKTETATFGITDANGSPVAVLQVQADSDRTSRVTYWLQMFASGANYDSMIKAAVSNCDGQK